MGAVRADTWENAAKKTGETRRIDMRVRPIATPALGWAFAPFAFLVLATGIAAAAANVPPPVRSNPTYLSASVTAALEQGDEEEALNAWQALCETPLSAGAESEESNAQTALLVAGRTMSKRGDAWKKRCATLARSVAERSAGAPGGREVARRLLRYATPAPMSQPRTAATIASASMP